MENKFEQKPNEYQVGGDHYKKFPIQPITYILENELDFTLGNIFKYICRYPYKGTGKQDLEKAIQYLQFDWENFKDKEFDVQMEYFIATNRKYLHAMQFILLMAFNWYLKDRGKFTYVTLLWLLYEALACEKESRKFNTLDNETCFDWGKYSND